MTILSFWSDDESDAALAVLTEDGTNRDNAIREAIQAAARDLEARQETRPGQ